MTPETCWYSEVCPLAPETCGPTCVRFAEMLNLVEMSNIPEYRWVPAQLKADVDIEQFRELKKIKDRIKDWVQEGNNLYLYSDTFGNGKTSWAVKLMLAYFNQIWKGNCFRTRGVFISVPEFFDRERLRINNEDEEFKRIRNDLLKVDLVIWDDVSSVKMTDYSSATFLNFIDARVMSKKSNIFTGNLSRERLEEFLGGRLSSRICNTSRIIQFNGEDKRGVYING